MKKVLLTLCCWNGNYRAVRGIFGDTNNYRAVQGHFWGHESLRATLL